MQPLATRCRRGPLNPLATIGTVLLAVACSTRPADPATPRDRAPAAETSSTPSPHSRPAASGPPAFQGSVSRIPVEIADEMRGTTWKRGCPVPLRDLRLLSLSYWDMGGSVREGLMVVNEEVARDVVDVFRRLFRARFPIGEMRLSEEYHPEQDDPHSRVSITASFNCRVTVTPAGPGTRFSVHSWGLAIDINPLQNPYVRADGFTRNRYARPYVDRAQDAPGMIHDGDVVVRAFERIGWAWGGHWSGGKDYMHFSIDGR